MRKPTIESTIVETRDLLEDLLREAEEKEPANWKKFEWSVVKYLNTRSSGSADCVGGNEKWDIKITHPVNTRLGNLESGEYEVKSIESPGVLAKLGDEKSGHMLSDEFINTLMRLGSYVDQHENEISDAAKKLNSEPLDNLIKYLTDKTSTNARALKRCRAYSRLEISQGLYNFTFGEGGVVSEEFKKLLTEAMEGIYTATLANKLSNKNLKGQEVTVQYKIGKDKAVSIGKTTFKRMVSKIVPELESVIPVQEDEIRQVIGDSKCLFRLYQIIENVLDKSKDFSMSKIVQSSISSVKGFFGVKKIGNNQVRITYIPRGPNLVFNHCTQGGRIALGFPDDAPTDTTEFVHSPDGIPGATDPQVASKAGEKDSPKKESTNESRARTPKREFSAVGGASPAAPGGMGPNVPLGMGPKATGKGRKRRAKKSEAQAILDRNAASQGRFWGGAKKLRSKPRVDEASSTQVSSGAAGYSVPSGTDFDGDGDTDIRNDRKRDRGSIYRGGNGDLEHNARQIGRHFAGAEVIDDTYELLSDLLAGRDLTPAQTRRFKRSAHEG